MRILHVTHQYMPEYIGGTELYTRWVAEGLSKREHDVSVFYHASDERIALSSRIDAYNVQVWSVSAGKITPGRRFLATFGKPRLLKAFRQVIAETKPEIIHIQHLMGLPISLVNYIRQMGIPYVVTLHDYWWVCANAQLITNFDRTICDGPQVYWNCARCALARARCSTAFWAMPPLMALLARRNRLLRNILMDTAAIIAPTQFVAGWYATHGISEQRITVLPHGLPIPDKLPARDRTRNKGIRFVYIGGLSWQKGVHILLEAFNGVDGNAELWIAGDETADPEYTARLRQLASPNVCFLGKLPRDEVWQTLALVDAVVVPSLWYETFSFIVSEAFAMEVPVIASNIGSLAERVRHGVDGLLVPPGDVAAWRWVLQQCASSPNTCVELKENIKPPITMQAYNAQIETIYRSAVER